MKITSTRFGEFDIDESKIIAVPEGILGFDDRRFTLITPEKHAPFCWFQSIDEPALAFVVVDARETFPSYTVALTSEESGRLMLGDGAEIVVLLVVTLAPEPAKITVNLQGPIVMNPHRMLAKQIVLEGSKYSSRHPLLPQVAGEVNASHVAG